MNKSTRRQRTMPRTSRKSKPQGTTGGATAKRLKDAYVAMQIKAMQRAAAPIALEFAIADLDGIKSLNQNLIRFALEKDLDARTLGAINGTIANQIRVLIPQQPMQVIQQTTVIQPDLEKVLKSLSEDEQVVLARAINRLDKQTNPSEA